MTGAHRLIRHPSYSGTLLILELLIALLHLPAALPERHRLLDRGLWWQVGERVLDRAIGSPFDQQPAPLRIGDVRKVAARQASIPRQFNTVP
jgi:hypothetical protein